MTATKRISEFEKITTDTIDEAWRLLQYDEVNEAVSSSFYGSARKKLNREALAKVVKAKPGSRAGTSLARAVSSIGRGLIFGGRVILYKPFFGEFNIDIGTNETAATLGVPIESRRVIVLLHELSHLTRRYIDIYQTVGLHYFDEAIYDKCTINKRIYDACDADPGTRI